MSVPGQPTNVTTFGGNATIIVSWTPPTITGSSPISTYTVTAIPGPKILSVSGLVSTATLTGVVNNTPYQVSVIATNKSGSSIPSNSIIPVVKPSPPTNVTVIYNPLTSLANISWVTPANNGGSAITGYTIVSNPDNITSYSSTSAITISSFTYGSPYTYNVTATNIAGISDPSSNSPSFTPIAVPDAPTSVAATLIGSGMLVTWQTPSSHGTNITGYNILSYTTPTVFTTTVIPNNNTSNVISTLVNGLTYQFAVVAKNSVGSSAISVLTSPVLYYKSPIAVTTVTATGVPTSNIANIKWSNPTANYGITAYNIVSIPYGVSTSILGLSTTVSLLSTTVSGLTFGTSYTFQVTATNSIGTSPIVASAAIIPSTVPNPPRSATAVAGNLSATISWTSSVPVGSSPAITGYTVTCSPGNISIITAGTILTCIFTGLISQTSYTFSVVANNINGSSSSIQTNSVIPYNTPLATSSITTTAYNGCVTLNWTPPSYSGPPITSYNFATTPAGGRVIYYDNVNCYAVIYNLTNGTPYTISVTGVNSVGAGLTRVSGSVTPSSAIVPPPYIPNAGPAVQPHNWAQSGQYVSIFAQPNFVAYNFAIPVGIWNTVTDIQNMSALTSGGNKYTIHGGDGNVSVVFPIGYNMRLSLYSGSNLTGYKIVYTSTTAIALSLGGGGQFPVPGSNWSASTYANSILCEQIGFMTINITILTLSDATIALPFTVPDGYNITVDWGDSSSPGVYGPLDTITYTYARIGNFIINISGTATEYGVGNGTAATGSELITAVTSWGAFHFTSLSGAFTGCCNLTAVPNIIPSTTTDTSYMFNGAVKLSQNLTSWNASAVTNAVSMFQNCKMNSSIAYNYPRFSNGFNTNFGTWTQMVINVTITSIAGTASKIALPFTIPVGANITVSWGDSTVDTYDSTDTYDGSGNQYSNIIHTYTGIGNYTITVYGNATGYGSPSSQAPYAGYNLIQGITHWGDLGLTSLSGAFLCNKNAFVVPSFIPSTVTDTSYMFYNCINFNDPNVINWNTTAVTNMTYMFYSASYFNQNISAWVTTSVENMDSMFQEAYTLSQNLSSWDTSSLTSAHNMFQNCPLANVPTNQPTSSYGSYGVCNHMIINISITTLANSTIALPIVLENAASIGISWGDSTYNACNLQSYSPGTTPTYKYSSIGNYTIVIIMTLSANGTSVPIICMKSYGVGTNTNLVGSTLITGVPSFGLLGNSFTSLSGAFKGCNALTRVQPTAFPTTVTDTSYMFYGATTFNQVLSGWDVTNVTTQTSMFGGGCPAKLTA